MSTGPHDRKVLQSAFAGRNQSKQHVEIEAETPFVIAKENAVLWIVNVRVNAVRVEVIGQVEAAHRQPQGIFVAHLEVFRDS